MNLHGVVRNVINSVNPDIKALFSRSAGYTQASNGKRTPKYAAPESVTIQVQALSGSDIRRLNGLNIQGVLRAVYMFGNAQGIVRPTQQGGDLLTFVYPKGASSQQYLVVQVLETWPDWSKVAVCLQL